MISPVTFIRIRVAFVPFIRVRMTPMPFVGMPSVPFSRRPRPLQIIKRLLIRIIPLRQFPLIEIVRRIGVAEFGVLFDILFRLLVRAQIGVLLLFVLVRSHITVFSISHKSRAGIEKTLALPTWHRLCRL
jgi:hypothetical protein